jgi:preprotein translocase subunit YajC
LNPTNPLLQFVPFAFILVLFYFLLVRPQQQKAEETRKMLDNLKVNDEVITSAGIFARIVRIQEKVLTVEIAPKIQVRMERSAVVSVQRQNKSAEEKSA